MWFNVKQNWSMKCHLKCSAFENAWKINFDLVENQFSDVLSLVMQEWVMWCDNRVMPWRSITVDPSVQAGLPETRWVFLYLHVLADIMDNWGHSGDTLLSCTWHALQTLKLYQLPGHSADCYIFIKKTKISFVLALWEGTFRSFHLSHLVIFHGILDCLFC